MVAARKGTKTGVKIGACNNIKVRTPYSDLYLNWIPIFGWCVVRLDARMISNKTCSQRDWTTCTKFIIHSTPILHNLGDLDIQLKDSF